MGWRTQDSYDRDERERRREYVRGLPWMARMAVWAWNVAVTVVVMGVFMGLVWAVVGGK